MNQVTFIRLGGHRSDRLSLLFLASLHYPLSLRKIIGLHAGPCVLFPGVSSFAWDNERIRLALDLA